MLRRGFVSIRVAFDLLRRSFVDAVHAARRPAGSLYFGDAACDERLVLVRSVDRTPHFRRYPRKRSPTVPPSAIASCETAHERAVRRLSLEIEAGEGLRCAFHDGTFIQNQFELVDARPYRVLREHGVSIGGRRLVPDLLVLCPRSGERLLVIEVRASHPVGRMKRRAYASACVPWIEVRAVHAISRFRRASLCVENWGGPGFGPPPHQASLLPEQFEQLPASAGPAASWSQSGAVEPFKPSAGGSARQGQYA